MTRLKLGEIAHEYKGKAKESEMGVLPIVGLEHLSSGDIDLAGFSEGGESTFTKKFLPGHVLFGRRRAYQRKASLAEFPGICSGDITVIEADEGALEPRLLPFIIQNDSLFDFAVENSAGSLSPRVKWARLAEYELDLPTLKKQRELADIFWAAQDVRRKYKQLLRASDDIVKSRFVEMFGTTTSELLGSWKTLTLAECVNSIDTGSSPKCKTEPRKGLAPGVLKLSALSSGSYLSSENKAMEEGSDIQRNKEVQQGDLLIARKNTPELVGACVLVKEPASNLMFPDLVFRMHPNSEIEGIYLVALLSNSPYTSEVRGLAHGTAQSMSNIPKSALAKLSIPVPPRVLQREFASFVQQVDKSKVALQQSLDELNATMAAILNEELGTRDV